MTGLVRTVRGDVPPGELGVTDAHDHLLLESPVIAGSPLRRRSAASAMAQDFTAAGGQALVQWTPPGMGRHAEWPPGIAERTGIHLIAATGLHQARHYGTGGPPRWPATLGTAELAALFTEELTVGMRGDNGMPDSAGPARAGVIKVAAGYHGTDEHERRALAAAGAAHRATGAPVCVQPGADTPTADRLDPNGSPGPAALLTDTAAALARRVGEDAMHAILAVNPGRAFAWRR